MLDLLTADVSIPVHPLEFPQSPMCDSPVVEMHIFKLNLSSNG